MRENDGRKLDHRTLEQMRFRAVDAVESGVHPEDVAASLGMGRGTVYGWLAKYREGGREALRARPVPGRAPKLSGEQMRRLYALIAGADPRQLEFGFALWTRDMVRTLIRREFNVSLSAVSVGRLLRTLGLSPQRPLWRAWQADPDAVERWKSEEFPAIRARAKAEGATIYFGDEAGVRSDYHAGTTWAPVGQTPVVKATGALWGSRTPPTLLTSGDQRNPAVGHDRRCVAAGAVSDLLAVAEAGLAPGTARCPKDVELLVLRHEVALLRRNQADNKCGLGRRAVFALVIRRLPRTLRATAWSPPARSCAGTSCGARNSAHCPEPRWPVWSRSGPAARACRLTMAPGCVTVCDNARRG